MNKQDLNHYHNRLNMRLFSKWNSVKPSFIPDESGCYTTIANIGQTSVFGLCNILVTLSKSMVVYE